MKEKVKVKAIIGSILILLAIISSLILATKWKPEVSFGSDTQELEIEAKLQKYINYAISDKEQGTLVQYLAKEKVKYGENKVPVKNSEIEIKLNKIDKSYPYEIKVFEKEKGTKKSSEYDQNTGTVKIIADNQNESNEYVVMCYYDTYSEEEPIRELKVEIFAKATLDMEEENIIENDKAYTIEVSENIGELTSINYKNEDIYNGYIKSNQINGTDYETEYQEKQTITISKKELQEKLELVETNAFIKEEQEIENNNNLIYKSTKITKDNIENLLGKDGTLEIIDNSQNIIETINKETNWEEDGSYTINYEEGPETINIKTSKIQNEGILILEHTKAIKESFTDSIGTKIKTTTNLIGEENKSFENTIELKEATTNVNMKMSSQEWTNKQQNEVTFDIELNANNSQNNLFRNPTLKIELPSEVEKVILQNSSIFYGNGIELQETYIQTNANGNIEIIANLSGEQTEYQENVLDLTTDIKITATVILKKDIENTTTNANLVFTNEYTLDQSNEIGNQEVEVKIENYKEEKVENFIEEPQKYEIATVQNGATIEGLKLEVAPVKGEVNLTNGDTVYEGEYIKYNIKVTNTSNEAIENIKVLGSVPEGTTYGELIADYYRETQESYYQFDDNITTKEIEIGTLKPGETISKFYEVQVKDLAEGIEEQQINSNIKIYIKEDEKLDYKITNIIKPAEAKITLTASLGLEKDFWKYHIEVSSKKEKQATVQLKLPKEFEVDTLSHNGTIIEMEGIVTISEDNIMTIKIDTDSPYYVGGYINRSKLTKETEESKQIITATASLILENGATYQSNENRILYEYESATISMTSDTEGEEVKYGEEINYKLTITNTGRTNLGLPFYTNSIVVNITDLLPKDIKPISVTYDNWKEEIEEISIDGEEEKMYKMTGEFSKLEPVTENMEGIGELKDKNGNGIPDINLYVTIPYKESVTVEIKAKAGLVEEKTKIENSATITGEKIKTKTSNTITHIILPDNSQNPEVPDNPEVPNNPEVPEEANKPSNPSNTDNKYSISGVAWLDENKDGKRQTNERTIEGIHVILLDSKHTSKIKETNTKEHGTYQFSELEKGDYIVVFQYDVNQYELTEYKKSDVSENVNSDAIAKKITLNGMTAKVGMIEITNLEKAVVNADIGLIENKDSNLKIDKTIESITIKTSKETKQYNYNNQKLAKIEIKAKEIEGANVTIEYKIVVTNEGETEETINKVIDNLPEGLNLAQESSKSWIKMGNNQFANILNQKIKPKESITVVLKANKTMTENSTGTFLNKAEINIKDSNEKDNYSEAEIIISVSTGIIIYISIGIVLSIATGIFVMLTLKYKIHKIGKIFLFTSIFVAIFASSVVNVEAKLAPISAYFRYDEEGVSGHKNAQGRNDYFYGTEATGDAICGEPENKAWTGKAQHIGWVNEKEVKTEVQKGDASFTLNKLNDDIEFKKIGSNYIYGPFKIYCSYYDEDWLRYEIVVNGGAVKEFTMCDSNGNDLEMNEEGNFTFYLKIPESQCKNGISSVSMVVTRIAYDVITHFCLAQVKYRPSEIGLQAIVTINSFDRRRFTTEEISSTQTLTWKNIRGYLEITKRDYDDTTKKLANVKVKISGYNNIFTTDSNGKISLENVPAKTYTITEISNPYYGYTNNPPASGTVTVKSGAIATFTLTNIKHTGNLQIVKKDPNNSSIKLQGVTFKIRNSSGQYVIAVNEANIVQKSVTGRIYLGNMQYTTNASQATEFKTDSNGLVEIINILEGTYYVQETSVGNYEAYELDDNYITWTAQSSGKTRNATVTVTRQKSQDTTRAYMKTLKANTLTMYNQRKYIKLSRKSMARH